MRGKERARIYMRGKLSEEEKDKRRKQAVREGDER